MVPSVHGDDGGFVILVNEDGEAIIEHKFGVRDIGDGNFHGGGFGGSRALGLCVGGGLSLEEIGSANYQHGESEKRRSEAVQRLNFQDFSPM